MESTTTITITQETLTDLIYIYEAVSSLETVLTPLLGDSYIPTIGDGIMGNLARIYRVVEKMTSLFDPDIDYEETEFCKLMESEISPEEKAARILANCSTMY